LLASQVDQHPRTKPNPRLKNCLDRLFPLLVLIGDYRDHRLASKVSNGWPCIGGHCESRFDRPEIDKNFTVVLWNRNRRNRSFLS
jgi:hypothetical protein